MEESYPNGCFRKASFPEASKGVIVWEWVKGGQNEETSHLLGRKHCEKWRNGENAGYQHFLLSIQSFQKPSSARSLKLKVFADVKLKVAKMMKFLFDMIENVVGKEHLLLLHTMFSKAFFFFKVIKRWDCVGKG